MTDLPPPRANPVLLGQAEAEAALVGAVNTGRLHHAWLLLGPPGIGKATLAFRFARRLLAGGAFTSLDLPASHPTFRRVATGSHADLLTIEREFDDKKKRFRSEIVVDGVREVTEFMHLTPAEAGWRVVVLDGAEYLNRNAANALLKVLEEPPPCAILLLVCSAAGRLLPTLRSRCRRLRMPRLAAPVMTELLGTARPDLTEADRARVTSLADGSIGRAIELADAGGVALSELADRTLGRLADLTTQDALAAMEALGREEGAFATFLDMLRDGLSARTRGAARSGSHIAGRKPDEMVAVWSALGRLKSATEGLHLDKSQALVQGFALLAGRARPDSL